MCSSSRFGSTAYDYVALLRLAFASAPALHLNLATYGNSLAHYAKGTRSGLTYVNALSQVVSTLFQVLFHSPYRGSFHLSLTVLVHYR